MIKTEFDIVYRSECFDSINSLRNYLRDRGFDVRLMVENPAGARMVSGVDGLHELVAMSFDPEKIKSEIGQWERLFNRPRN